MSAGIVFPEFDGVTHPDGCLDVNFFGCMSLIEDVLQELAQAALPLDGRRALDLITTESDLKSVKDLLTRMEYGMCT